ncbi:MAG: type II toxin-antitoxin system RelE/ParE family toxin [Flavobacterium sp.]|nr:type II toxin-antitoxin system RelE/ParE family toxin [Flavobacterium sp.]MBP7470998.1 type II toxin-antitoxin system RelE/ParE family toxin [Flavobacterium sp.]
MSYNIVAVPTFKKELKRLAKKYHSLKTDLAILFESLEKNPEQGTFLGKNCYKIRLSISSKNKGKSGGARIITNIVITEETVFLLSIYDKSEKDNLTDKELEDLISSIPE